MIYMVLFNDPFIGNLAQEFEKVFATTTTSSYPPYNIIKLPHDDYILEFALAGFSKDDVQLELDNRTLTISAQVAPSHWEGSTYLHKGIATRKFSRKFSLPEYYEVTSAGMSDGILKVTIVKNIPEEKKPKAIEIS
jgi:molecular chaperone IbpA